MSVRWTETDRYGNVVQLTEERWQHICAHHGDMIDKEPEIRECIRDPNVIYREESEEEEVLKFFRRREQRPPFIVSVVVMARKPFIVTARLDDEVNPKPGAKLIWIKL